MTVIDRTPAATDITSCGEPGCNRVLVFDRGVWVHVNPVVDGHEPVVRKCPHPGCGWWPRFVVDSEDDWEDLLAVHRVTNTHVLELEALGANSRRE